MSGISKNARIYVAGHGGMVGSAILRRLVAENYTNLITRTHDELDLTNQQKVEKFFQAEVPEYVFLAAAKVGGIYANSTYPAEFIYSNLAIQTNVLHQSYVTGVKKLLFLGSSCIYPRDCPQPIKAEYLLTGPIEKTNEAYAIAKIAGIKMCQFYNQQYGTHFVNVIPTNLYGPGDNYDLETSHALPALIRKVHQAKLGDAEEVTVWGTGKSRREFLHSNDLAEACVFLMSNYENNDLGGLVNIGYGQDTTIAELAKTICDVIGFDGKLIFDSSKPDGMPVKVLDANTLSSLGWSPKISLREGIQRTYQDFLAVVPDL